MKQMVTAGEIDALVAERVWKELERALTEKNPETFFNVLASCNALQPLFPALQLDALIQAAKISSDPQIRFAALLSDLSAAEIKALCERYRAPSEYRDLALLVASHAKQYQRARELSAEELLDLLQAADAFRREIRFRNFLIACKAAARANSTENSQSAWLLKAYDAAKTVNTKTFLNLSGKEIAEALYKKRVEAIIKLLND